MQLDPDQPPQLTLVFDPSGYFAAMRRVTEAALREIAAEDEDEADGA